VTTALQRQKVALVYLGVAVLSLYVGTLVARNEQGLSMLLLAVLALCGLVMLASLPTEFLFLGWLFCAPLLQNSADLSALGRGLTWALYTAPAVFMAALTVIRQQHRIPASFVDWMPATYVLYVLGSMMMTSDVLQASPVSTAKAVFTVVALGPIIYYFLTFGPGVNVHSDRIVITIMVAGLCQGALAILEATVGWSLWGHNGWQGIEGGTRVIATLANPGVLGAFLGVAIVVSVSILTWGGPRTLRRTSWATVAVCTPSLFATLTRGPVLATAVALVLVLLLGRARLLGLGVLVASALVVVILLPGFRNTEAYRERVAQRSTLEIRTALQDVSLQLAAEKPLLGWGYGSFDRVKNSSEVTVQGLPVRSVLETTSHDTYLTKLVELGTIGLLLFVAPFLILGYRGIAGWTRSRENWIVVASMSSLLVLFLSALTLDFRFFSLAQALPFVFLAILRRKTAAHDGLHS